MLKVLKNLKQSWFKVLAIVALLCLQAACDLELPNYTSKIVNVGIQAGGIEEKVPSVLSKEDYDIIIDTIIKDLNNSNKNLINILNKKMQDEISKLNFEKAKDINNDIVLLKSLSHKQDIINNANENKPILAWINLDDENIKIYVIKGAKLLKSELIKVEDFELDNLIYTIKEQILRNEENIAEEVVDKYYIDFANILYSYIKSNKDINYKYI